MEYRTNFLPTEKLVSSDEIKEFSQTVKKGVLYGAI